MTGPPSAGRPDTSTGARRWAAVVVNYNAGPALAGCVASVLADDSAGPAELVVVDNGSDDGSVDALRRAHPAVTVIDPGGNLGYARAANLGAAATSAPVVAVLNPDTVLRPGTAAAILRRFDTEPDLGAAGPTLRNPDGSVYPSARRDPALADAVGHGLCYLVWPDNPYTARYRQTGEDPTLARDVDWISGAAIWLRRSALDAVGGWDERYFMYVEDVDLCWRLRAGGWRVAYEPGASVEHLLGVSTSAVPYRMIAEHHRSLLRFAARSRFTGRKRILLPAAAGFLGARAGVAMAQHRLKARPVVQIRPTWRRRPR